ncbi:hypothetical protein KAX22_00040 [bacterium]|nr:hypothetical protein [bacterium]
MEGVVGYCLLLTADFAFIAIAIAIVTGVGLGGARVSSLRLCIVFAFNQDPGSRIKDRILFFHLTKARLNCTFDQSGHLPHIVLPYKCAKKND